MNRRSNRPFLAYGHIVLDIAPTSLNDSLTVGKSLLAVFAKGHWSNPARNADYGRALRGMGEEVVHDVFLHQKLGGA